MAYNYPKRCLFGSKKKIKMSFLDENALFKFQALLCDAFVVDESKISRTADPARYPENEKRKNFACENSFVNLQCKLPGERIRILLANYGRFSLYVCGMGGIDKDWNVQCSAEESISIISQRK
ncbi:LPHN-like protein [Mya arenaria]|uniref:LPHN-like protein n=1 Tax=Mya arenaria TaxID=6604 RepID=A0ABY7FTA2_MYAAR|nr:LPHN-like protein [Mya arenaria]